MNRNALWIWIVLMLCMACKPSVSEGLKVTVSGGQLYIGTTAYQVRGVCYHPVPKGSTNIRSFETLEQDIALMKEAGINTIRVYEPIGDMAVLDTLHARGIKVIMGFGYRQNGKYDIASGTYKEYIAKFKSHKAILFWELGNEYNYHPEWFDNALENWYRALNTAALEIHNIDPNRPVATAHGDLPSKQVVDLCEAVDIWGMNVYRWDNPSSILEEWQGISNKPMYISEAGADSFMTVANAQYEAGVNERAQADATDKILRAILEAKQPCIGLTLFSFTDGWWKAGNVDKQDRGGWAPNSSGVPYDGAPNEEFWGIVDIDRRKKEVFFTLKKWYTK